MFVFGTWQPPGRERLERLAQAGDPGRRERAERRAVVGDLAGDHLGLVGLAGQLEVLAGELQRRLDGLAAAAGEEHAVQVAGRERGDPRRELDRRRMRVGPVGEEAELLGLVGAGLGDVGAAVADVDAEQRREAVEVAVAVLVVDVAALAADDDRHLVVGVRRQPREVHPQVAAGQLLKRAPSRSARLFRARHALSSEVAVLYNGTITGCSTGVRQTGRVVPDRARMSLNHHRTGYRRAARADPRDRQPLAGLGARCSSASPPSAT